MIHISSHSLLLTPECPANNVLAQILDNIFKKGVLASKESSLIAL